MISLNFYSVGMNSIILALASLLMSERRGRPVLTVVLQDHSELVIVLALFFVPPNTQMREHVLFSYHNRFNFLIINQYVRGSTRTAPQFNAQRLI